MPHLADPSRRPVDFVSSPVQYYHSSADHIVWLPSKLCGHSYSSAAIREYLRGGRQQCPATGCNKQLVLSDLEVDKGLAKRAKEAARRERARDEDDDDDDDDVIE